MVILITYNWFPIKETATWQILQILYGGIGVDEHKRCPSGTKEDQRPPQDSSNDNELK